MNKWCMPNRPPNKGTHPPLGAFVSDVWKESAASLAADS
jgi:hypothetical protein